VHRFQGGEVHSFHPLTINALVDGGMVHRFQGGRECIGFRGGRVHRFQGGGCIGFRVGEGFIKSVYNVDIF
jgi:hypothetical protein